MTITALPTTPLRTQTQAEFNANMAAWIAALPTWTTEANALGVQVAANAADALAGAAAAAKWISGTTYAIGDVRWSPANYANYRRKTVGAGATDPASDSTNWASVNSLASLSLTGTTTVDVLVGTSVTDATSTTAAGTKFAGGLAVLLASYFGGLMHPMAGIVFSGGASAASTIWQGAANGLQIRGYTGAYYDLVLYNGAGSAALSILTGTNNVAVGGNLIAGAGIIHKSYTVATRPAHSAGNIIFVSDGGAGAVFQGSTGAAWVNLG